MFTVKVEICSFDNLYEMVWGQAKDQLKTIDKYGLQDELMDYLDELFSDFDASDTQVNDYLAYEFDADDFVMERKELDDIEDLDDLYNLFSSYKARQTIRDAQLNDKETALLEYIRNNFSNYNIKEIEDELEDFDLDDLEEE